MAIEEFSQAERKPNLPALMTTQQRYICINMNMLILCLYPRFYKNNVICMLQNIYIYSYKSLLGLYTELNSLNSS